MRHKLFYLASAFLVCSTVCRGAAVEPPRVSGTVYDTGFGQPVADANVCLVSGKAKSCVVSNADGSFSIENLPKGGYTTVVACPGFKTLTTISLVDFGDTELELPVDVIIADERVGPTATVSGAVRDAEGKPIRGATVTAVNPFNGKTGISSKTDANGHFSIALPKPGQYVVYGSKPGFKVDAQVVVARGIDARADLVLQRLKL